VSDVGYFLLLVLAVLLPFELRDPLFRIGPIQISSVEICLYMMLTAWGAALVTRRHRHWTLVHTTVAAYVVVLFLSAIHAPSHGDEALKFALRSLGGCALFFAASDLVRTPRAAGNVSLALLAGSLVSAAAAFAEIWRPGAANWLMLFKTQPSWDGNFLRASGTFQYANIASMYWEATLPFAIVLPVYWRQRRSGIRWSLGAGIICGILLIEAIFLAASRAGILIAILIPVMILSISRASLRRLRATAGAILASILVLLTVHALSDPLIAFRLTARSASSWYRATYRDFPPEFLLKSGEWARIQLTVANSGRVKWHALGRQSVRVSYHWLDQSGQDILIWNGARSQLPSDVEPGGVQELVAWILPPAAPGRYKIQWDMVQEDVAWFSSLGSPVAEADVEVLPPNNKQALPEPPSPVAPPPTAPPDRMQLWRAAISMWLQKPLLGVGPDNYRHQYGVYLEKPTFDDRIHANNLYLETLATTGAAGVLSFVAVLAAIAISLRRAWGRATDDAVKLLLLGLAVALAAYCLHGLVDYFFEFTPTYGLFWLLAGIAVASGEWRNHDDRETNGFGRI